MIELAILGLLKERPMHGYQLSRELADQLGGLWRVSYGSLYPTLRRLERDAAVEKTAGPTGGRRKTVYRITPAGEQQFLDLLQDSPAEGAQFEDARFRVRLAFFRYLPPETRIRLLERRRTNLQARLTEIKHRLRAPGALDDYQRALMEHGSAAIEADVAWLTDLIHQEHAKHGIKAPRGERRRASATLRRKERTA